MKKALIGVAVAVVLALVVWASLRDAGPRGLAVEVQAAQRRTVSARVKGTGEITPEKKVEISAKVVGEIIGLPVVEGQEVRAGQLLVEIERDLYEAARDQARAALRQAQVSVRRQEVQLADACPETPPLRAVAMAAAILRPLVTSRLKVLFRLGLHHVVGQSAEKLLHRTLVLKKFLQRNADRANILPGHLFAPFC